MQVLTRWRNLVLAALLATIGLVGLPHAASAAPNACGPWHNEQDMADTSDPGCRETWLVDPGQGHLLTRADILTDTARALFNAKGFDRRWLWYAPAKTVTLPDGFGPDWSSCPEEQHVNGVCPTTSLLTHPIGGNFVGGSVTMDVFAYRGNFISQVCGNYGEPLRPQDPPTPKIAVHKFNDLNRNGVQDPGEPPLAGWTFQLVRQSSLFHDQDPGLADTATTDASGNLTFLLRDNAGPGNYIVQEVPQDDWVPITAAAQPVVVPDGAEDNTVASLSFGNAFQAITATGTSITPTEGVPFTGTVASFTDPDAAAKAEEYRASVDWGDGHSGAGNVSGPVGGPFTVTGTHTYAEEDHHTVTVTINDVDNAANTATVTTAAVVGDAGLSPGAPATIAPVEGAPFTGTVGTFGDANPGGTVDDFSATVDWGDGHSGPGTVSGPVGGPFTVAGTHTYGEEGSYPLTVSVLDHGGATATLTGTANVGDAALTAVGYPNLLSTNPVTNLPVATFTDANPGGTVADFSATVDWGDGTAASRGAVSGADGGPFTVTGSHTYATLGPKTITVHIVDDGGATATAVSHLILFAYPTGGDFVIGDATTATGAHVNFWGSQWWKNNPLSGGAPPAAFKGFEDNPAVPSCGGTWMSRPGNSSNPPDTVPTYMAVIVSTHVGQNGSSITGDVQHIVIVATDPGYGGNPGHDGNGTIVATLC